MNTEIHEDMIAIDGEDSREPRMVKCYWLFDTENGAPSAPPAMEELNNESQGEE